MVGIYILGYGLFNAKMTRAGKAITIHQGFTEYVLTFLAQVRLTPFFVVNATMAKLLTAFGADIGYAFSKFRLRGYIGAFYMMEHLNY